ncbi:HAUS augmin-like complex subunit 6 [Astyanax mexicanus]|uniref:HAUS augmin-like complex subunit 6 n=1 Tax=Astyanax mexicanus TaxID=7994 RepID=UPI0020CAE8DA|nr:HAUS augmin-like complex subunit 6 [Astyanax mexicanus]
MMSHLQEANGKYLWWFLQSLEFHLDGSADKSKHLNLGMNMFDKPNKEAFYIVTHFLFKKLNPSRTLDVFRHCWPILNRKHDAEFRKVAFGWLQEIANEEGSSFPKVVASHLLSPSGPRFVNLMLHLAKHVMVKLMKTYTTDGTWVPEAAAVPASNPDLLMKRCQMVKRHFERASVAQDSLIQDYQKRARYLEKSLKSHKAEEVNYIDLLKKYENTVDLEGESLSKTHHKVQILWAEIDKSLSGLEGEHRILDSVIQGNVDQYVLDGKDICVKIPAILLERMERLSHQTSIGSLYEGGQPVLLRLLELLNVVLSILSEERAKVSCPSLQLNQQTLQEQALLMRRSKETLKNMRRNLAKGDIPQTKNTIKKLEVDWEKKWAECLRHTPLISFLNEDPVLDFISPMAPLSFEPATEASFKASIFSQYPAKPPESVDQTLKEKTSSKNEDVNTEVDFSRSISAMDKTEDLLFSSCFASPRCTSPYMARPGTPTGSAKAPAFAPTPSPFQTSNGRNFTSQTKTSALKPRAQIMELEYDNLASQFAEAVAMSPLDGRRSGMELEQLLNTLSDPFTTKKQLPRTPESLLMDVRASWRKAVEEGKTEKKHEKKHENDSDSVLRTPSTDLRNPKPVFPSASESVGPLPCSSPPFQQEASAHSTITWDSTQLEALGQNSSNIIELSIAQETFPEMEDDFSFNCGGDELQEVESEGEDIELVLPPVILHSPEEAEPALQVARKRLATLGESPFIAACREMEAEVLPSAGRKSFGLSNCSGEKVFSLDLEQLEGFSSPLREELTLPNLVTFSPMDEF